MSLLFVSVMVDRSSHDEACVVLQKLIRRH